MAYRTASPRRTNFPVSTNQENLLRRLQNERQIVLDWAGVSAHTVRSIHAVIDDYLRAPRIPAKAEDTAQPGYYVLDGEVLVVVENKNKTGTYAKHLIIDGGRAKWVYAPGVGSSLAQHGFVPLSVAEAAHLGKKYGVCVICSKPLTDDTTKGPDGLTSIERGIGPVCAKRLVPQLNVDGTAPSPSPLGPLPVIPVVKETVPYIPAPHTTVTDDGLTLSYDGGDEDVVVTGPCWRVSDGYAHECGGPLALAPDPYCELVEHDATPVWQCWNHHRQSEIAAGKWKPELPVPPGAPPAAKRRHY